MKCAIQVLCSAVFCFYQGVLLAQSTISGSLSSQFVCVGDCVDFAAEINDGLHPFSYVWSTGATDSLINVCATNAGIVSYTLTVTDSRADSIVLNASLVPARTSRKPTPSVTSPVCVGETAYFRHPNVPLEPTYHWSGPNGFSSNEVSFKMENLSSSDAGTYYLYLDYFDGCLSDTVAVELRVEDVAVKPICEELNTCNFSCGVLEVFELRGDNVAAVADRVPKDKICGNAGEDVNAVWLGLVAQEGEHIIKIRARTCQQGIGLRYGIYDNCDLSNLIACSEACTTEDFIISSDDLVPGQEYYIYADGCGANVCEFSASLEGLSSSALCNDYYPISNITDWHTSSSDFLGTTTFWTSYVGDTTINSRVYRKISIGDSPLLLLMREDIPTRKVYQLTDSGERLLYDFNLEVGDLYFDPVYQREWFVDEIELIQTTVGPLRRFWLSSTDGFIRWFYDEGMGAILVNFPAHQVLSDPVFSRVQVYAGCTQIVERANSSGYNEVRSTITLTEQTICAGDSFDGYTVSGNYVDTLSADGGCLNLRRLALEVLPTDTVYLPVTLCDGEVLDVAGLLVDSVGGLYVVEIDTMGCESYSYYLLDTVFADRLTIDTTICPNDSLVIQGYPEPIYQSGDYEIAIEDTVSGCTAVQLDLSVSILPVDDSRCLVSTSNLTKESVVSVYPNPAGPSVRVSSSSGKIGKLCIYDMNGQAVYVTHVAANTVEVDVETLPVGVYYIECTKGHYRHVEKFIKL